MRLLTAPLVIAVSVLTACGTSSAPNAPTTTAPSSTTTQTSPATPTTPPTTPSPQPSATVMTVPVYLVAEVSPTIGPRLYREWRRVPTSPDRVTAAVGQMLTGTPVDPDYRSLWPSTTRVRSVTRTGSTLTVDLTAYVTNLGAAYEGMAIQQLVYTVTAADPTVRYVLVRTNGSTPPSGHIDLSRAVTRAAALDVQANVWILAPTQGATVRSPVTVTVYGTGFEGNVPLRIYRGSTLVAQQPVTTMMGGFAQAQATFTLPAGTYEVRAYNDNGKDATLQLWDTKSFRVS